MGEEFPPILRRVYTMVLNKKTLFRFLVSAALALLLGWLIFGSPLLVHADAILTIEPITWNVVGLDSNNVNVGPNNFPVGVRVCNTGDDPATNVVADFIWDSSDAYIDIRAGSLNPITISTLAAGACFDYYFEVEISRDANAYDHTREYHIEVSSNETSTISTPTPREIYVEHLISQSRNSTTDVLLDTVSVAPGGTMTLMLWETYDIELVGSTATNGYEQIESYINFPNTIFQINSVTTTYTAFPAPHTDPLWDEKVYADGCSWESDPNSPNYRSCLSTGKYGGDITVTYNVTIIDGAGTSETLNTLIYDFSGSSYHYNSDFSVAGRIAAIVDPSLVTIDKNFVPDPTSVTGTSTLTFTLSNPNDVAISGANFTDTFPNMLSGAPGDMVVASPATYSTNGCGTPTFAPVAGAGSISFSDGTIPSNGSCTVSVQVSTTAIGTYNNTSSTLLIDTTDTGNSASDDLVVNDDPPTPAPICGYVLGEWTVPSTATNPPDSTGGAPTTQATDVSTALASVGSGLAATSIATNQGYNDNYSWRADGGFETGAFVPSQNNYFRFQVDTSQYTQVSLTFWAWRTQNGPKDLHIYYGTTGSPPETLKTSFTEALGTGIGSARTWTSFSIDFTGNTSTSGDTYFYIYGANSNNINPGADLHLDLITFNGCQIPDPPTLIKSFSPDPIAVNGTSTLAFTLTNPNAVDLTDAAFDDTYPAGLVNETPANASTTCAGGTVTTVDGGGSVSLSGGTIPASGTCVVTVDVTATTSGPHTNVSGFISTFETGENTGPDGFATDTLTALVPASISKQFSPNPILVNGTSTLTFAITNPNPDNQLTNVAFSDTYPANLVNETPANASTTCTGGTVTAVDDGGSISLSGATIAGGGSCTVQVDVTSVVVGSYANTSGAVTADIVGGTDTASDTLVVEPVRPAISLLKQVSSTGAAPWTTFVGVNVGDSVWYQFTVENTGDVALTTVSVTDPILLGLGVDLSGCTWANLALYETQACVVGPVTAVSGSNSNTATAHGTYSGTEYTDTSTATYATTGLTLVKTAAESTFVAAGDVLNYSYLVTNSGFAPLLGPVTIDDDKATDESCPDVDTVGDNDDFLDPGESITCTATYTILPADVTTQSVTNTADATVDGVTSNTDSETVTYLAPPTVTKVFLTTPITAGQTSTLIITLNNPGGTDLTGVTFTDTYPAAIENANPTNASTTCTNGTVTAVAGGGTVALSGATIAANTACNVRVDVTSYIPGAHTNTIPIGGVTTDQGVSNNVAATDTLTVTAIPPTVTKVFNPDTIGVGGTSTLTLTLGNTNGVAATLTSAFVDTLPANVVVENPANIGGTCAGTVTATPGGSTITYANGSTIPSGGCTIDVDVTTSTVGTHTNTIAAGDLQTDFGNNAAPASDDLTVTILAPTVTKVFSPDTIPSGGTSTITITIVNPNTGTGLTGVGFSDTYPAGVVNATPPGTTNSCGGTVTAVAGGGILSLSGGSIGADASCQVTVDVTSSTPGTVTNTTSVVASNEAPDSGTASDDLTVVNPELTLVKTITSGDPYANVGDVLSYSFLVTNSGNVTLDGPFTVSDDRATDESCPVTVTLAPGASITCTASYTVTQVDLDAGSVTNTATASGSFGGNPVTSGPDSETVTATQSPSFNVTKTESSTGPYAVGDTITYDIDVDNTGNMTLTGVTVTDPDTTVGVCAPVQPGSLAPGATMTCPASYVVTQADVDAGSFTNTATGDSNETGPDTGSEMVTFTQSPGITMLKEVSVDGGSSWQDANSPPGPSLASGTDPEFRFTVTNSGNVTLSNVGLSDTDMSSFFESDLTTPCTIPGTLAPGGSFVCYGTLTWASGQHTDTATGSGDFNSMTYSDTDDANYFGGSPSLNVTKTETSTGPYGVGDTITYDIDVLNTGNVTLTGVTVSDPDTTVGVCTPVQPASLAPGTTMTCPASYVVTQADVDAGSFTNTATGDSNETGPDTGSETVTFTQNPALNVTKTETSTGPYGVGDTITYDIDVLNTGNVTLTGVTGSDPDTTVGVCAPVQPGSLTPGATMTCPASYVVTQADVDAGSFTNTATGDSNETGPDTGSETVLLAQSPALTLVKTITSGDPYSSVGDILNYSFAVTNSGNVTLDGSFTVADDRATDESCPPTATLAPGASITCTASYTVTQTDLDNGSVTNTATTTGSFGGNPVTSGPDSETANAAVPIVIDPGVTKSGDPLTAQVGDTVTFTLFVFNTGNADADNVIVIDIIPSFLDIIPPVVISPLGPGVTIAGNTITMDFGTVEPSESWTVTITTVVNALGVPPGDTNIVTLTTDSDDDDTDNNDDSVFITIRGDSPLLPGTGFAPDRVTALPQMPTDYAYLSYGELRLEIPKLDVDTSIVGVPRDGDGWDVTWLWDQAGYLGGTAFPTWSGNSVITGHVVLANGLEGPFADLKELEYGDAVIVHGWGEQYVYEIREVDVVSPYDPSVLRHEEYPWLTLVTCAGFDETSDSYRWRVVARAVMLSIESEAGNWTSSSSPEQHDIQTFDRVGSGGVQP